MTFKSRPEMDRLAKDERPDPVGSVGQKQNRESSGDVIEKAVVEHDATQEALDCWRKSRQAVTISATNPQGKTKTKKLCK